VSEGDRPHAGPALATVGGLVLLIIGLAFFTTVNPSYGPPVSLLTRTSLFLLTGPGLVVCGIGLLAYFRPRWRLLLGSILVPLGLLGLFDGAAGGYLLGSAFVVAGGLYTVSFEPETPEAARTDQLGLPARFRKNFWAVPLLFSILGVGFPLAGPSFASITCSPSSPPCNGGGPCPVYQSSCGPSPILWIVFLGSAVFLAPLAFLLRARLRSGPSPFPEPADTVARRGIGPPR
jgi:hypothetical protein